ncbi:hypothetical protein L798_11063 [Zootermopsis nevadensis]|uniref:Uncharacterized protein n=1 Tax=Zootermopsis nevadensis TaxID=136037 RepID=A0A067R6V9_ZOONE|nr:hypothetical protein L798_11063 [Zootermopsis nevadensis]
MSMAISNRQQRNIVHSRLKVICFCDFFRQESCSLIKAALAHKHAMHLWGGGVILVPHLPDTRSIQYHPPRRPRHRTKLRLAHISLGKIASLRSSSLVQPCLTTPQSSEPIPILKR